ncbi:MAG: hypothetical protein LBC68_11030 [Prevotellaceae bacterium]|jgi:hypothetical protein|nr:hypothetical protein [Prevotellaceae bacterium]
MKKTVFILSISLLSYTFVQAQKWSSFAQFGAGVGLSVNEDNYGIMFQGEYGKTYKKWLDLSLTMTYETEMPFKNYNNKAYILMNLYDEASIYNNRIEKSVPNNFFIQSSSTSLAVNARIDMVKLFLPQSRHSFKVGSGLRCEFVQDAYISADENFNDGQAYNADISNEIIFLPTLRASYEFDIKPRFTMGAFFYYGYFSPCVGLSVRHNF